MEANFPAPPLEAVPAQSLLSFYLSSLGVYVFFLLLAALIGLAITTIVVIRGRGPLASAALVLAVSLPLLIGLYGAIDGALNAYMVIAASPVQVKPSQIAEGISACLVSLQVGVILTGPILLLALFGSLVRSLMDNGAKEPTEPTDVARTSARGNV